MAEALLSNDQITAAGNEIQRVRAKDPKRIDALMLEGGIQRARADDGAMERALRRILEIDPEHRPAREVLSLLLRACRVNAFNTRNYRLAWGTYREVLKYAPADPHILALLGEVEFLLGRRIVALACFDTALAGPGRTGYVRVFNFGVRQQRRDEAQQILDRAEEPGLATPKFYAEVGGHSLENVTSPRYRRRKFDPEWEQWARELVQRGLTRITVQFDLDVNGILNVSAVDAAAPRRSRPRSQPPTRA